MMDPGASMGKGYGRSWSPASRSRPPSWRRESTAIAGKHTTSALLLRLYVGDPPLIEVAFDKIPTPVREGQAGSRPAHPRRPDHRIGEMGLQRCLDLARMPGSATPGCRCRSGSNVTRRDLGDADSPRAAREGLRRLHRLGSRQRATRRSEYAMRYGRGIDKETCRRFVLMYVNDLRRFALGRDGRAAIDRLLLARPPEG